MASGQLHTMTTGIYKIRNVINEHIYIGSAVNISKRWNKHTGSLRNGIHHSIYLQRAWDKYGEESFEFSIIEECSKEDLLMREQHFIDTLSPEYNVCKVAGSTLGTKHSAESLEKMRVASSNMSDEHRKKLSESHKGVKRLPFSDEHRAKISKAKNNISAETREKLSAWQVGRKLSAETRAKISVANKGRIVSELTRKKLSEANKGKTINTEHRAKISKAKKGKVLSLKHREKLSEAIRKWWEKKINNDT